MGRFFAREGYKNINEIIAPITCNIFNSSIMKGNFPKKNAEILPINKSSSSCNLNNYRLISLLSTIFKIFEKLMRTRLKNNLLFNNVFHDNQFGFQANSSTKNGGRRCHNLKNGKEPSEVTAENPTGCAGEGKHSKGN